MDKLFELELEREEMFHPHAQEDFHKEFYQTVKGLLFKYSQENKWLRETNVLPGRGSLLDFFSDAQKKAWLEAHEKQQSIRVPRPD